MTPSDVIWWPHEDSVTCISYRNGKWMTLHEMKELLMCKTTQHPCTQFYLYYNSVFKNKIYLYCYYLCVCMSMCLYMCIWSVCGSQKRGSDTLELELQAFVRYSVWVLGSISFPDDRTLLTAVSSLHCLYASFRKHFNKPTRATHIRPWSPLFTVLCLQKNG